MAMNDRISTRIDPKLKAKAEAIFAKLGLSTGEAIRMFYAQVDIDKALPFQPALSDLKCLSGAKDNPDKARERMKKIIALSKKSPAFGVGEKWKREDLYDEREGIS